MTILTRISQRIERWLYRKGYELREVRQLVASQIMLAGLCVLAAVLLGWLFTGLAAMAAGALLVTWNFMSLSLFAQGAVHRPRGAVSGQLVRFYGRLFITGLALAALIVWAEVSVTFLLAGLSTVVVTILLWGARQMGHKAKEA